jgi:hypothetical protein
MNRTIQDWAYFPVNLAWLGSEIILCQITNPEINSSFRFDFPIHAEHYQIEPQLEQGTA